jgi:hypothetical protein
MRGRGGRLVAMRVPLAGVLALACGAAALAQPPSAGEPPYAETVVVVESSVVVELPPDRPDPDADDVLVLEGGIQREVTRLEALGPEDPWELLVWIDGALCRPESLGPTLLALARHAATLARLGSVRVVVADERPREVVAPSRHVLELETAFAALSRDESVCAKEASRLLWDARAAPDPAAAEGTLQRLVERVDSRARELARFAGRCPHDACAVLYVAHGYPHELDLALPERLRSPGALAAGERLAAATAELARQLALGRWSLLALPFQRPPPPGADDEALPREARPGPDAPPPRRAMPEGFGRDDEAGLLGVKVWPRGKKRRARTNALPARAWDVFLLPEMAPLRALADGTGGMLLRVPEQLGPALAELGARTRIWYRTTPLAPGEVRTLQVLVGSPPRSALGPAWVGAVGAPGPPP